jgi:hypothetical protein
MKPHPKLTKDGTVKKHSGWCGLAGDEDIRQDLCEVLWIIPADW